MDASIDEAINNETSSNSQERVVFEEERSFMVPPHVIGLDLKGNLDEVTAEVESDGKIYKAERSDRNEIYVVVPASQNTAFLRIYQDGLLHTETLLDISESGTVTNMKINI
ncbi:MAG: hypothetical protein C0602_06100 [Denitrovibrio sp.]|nr:MAG: hypothetical protein C0602_06100 [Denitrovibrio sp.]